MGIGTTHRFRRIGIILFVLAILSYGLFQARDLIIGPIITIDAPRSGAALDSPLVVISGHARNISNITLNDRRIFVNEEGHFSEQLLVSEGYTIMTLEAHDRFGRRTEKILELVYN